MNRLPSLWNGRRCLVLGLLALASCQSSRTPIEGDDDAFFGGLRATIPFTRAEPTRGRGEAHGGENHDQDQAPQRDAYATRFGLRIEVEGAGGEFHQDLAVGESVQLEDMAFSGPGRVTLDFDHRFVGVGLNIVRPRPRGVNIDGAFGVAGSFLKARASDGFTSESADLDSVGPFLDGTLLVRLHPALALFLEGQLFWGVLDSTDTVQTTTLRGGIAWSPLPDFTLSAGFAQWNLEAERESGSPDPSDLDLELEGPFVRVDFGL